MKLLEFTVENARSFLGSQTLDTSGGLSIVVGPNGGGKTNLLDSVTWFIRRHLLQSWYRRPSATPDNPLREELLLNDMLFNGGSYEKHYAGALLPQKVRIAVEVTRRDAENIQRMFDARTETSSYWSDTRNFVISAGRPNPGSWNDVPIAGERLSYEFVNGQLQDAGQTDRSRAYLNYLNWYDLDAVMRRELKLEPLSFPMLSLPIRRSTTGFSSNVTLPSFNEYDLRRAVDAASSRSDANLASLATGRLALLYRQLLSSSPGDHEKQFNGDRNVKALTEALGELGYNWKLVEISAQRNEYDIQLTKHGSTFRAGLASSGEKELLTYLFGIYALDVRDALVVIDEPELHLHPRWQVTLLNLFEKLSTDTGNQFVMATHSPAFISPTSIQYVSRVYSDGQQSRIVRLDSESLPERKHLFNIVNSFNNERIFFTDRVILVEGISDRIFFEALLRQFRPLGTFGQPYEVVSVGGKSFFERYTKLLEACGVDWRIVADRDYAADIGDSTVKRLFRVDPAAIKGDLIDPKNLDGEELLRTLEAIAGGADVATLSSLVAYIKSRRLKLLPLSIDQQEVLTSFIDSQRPMGRFILKRGALEAYLPIGHGRKDLDRLIALTTADDFWSLIPSEGKAELEQIAQGLLA